MPFFLLAKGAAGDLHLVSDALFDTRPDAIAELNRLTADSGFGHWDAQLFVADVDTATEVLLVRPAAAEPASSEAPADEPEQELAEEPEEEPAEETEPADAVEPEPDGVIEGEPEDEALAAVLEELGTEADAAVSLEEAPLTAVDDAWAEAVATSEQTEPEVPALKDALMRTAAQMEAEGITAPESVGPDEQPVEPAGEDEGAAAWPWDTAAPEEAAFTLDALEEPGTDDVSLVRAAGDDDTMAAARPVILGAYDDAPPADQPISAPMGAEIPDTVQMEDPSEAPAETLVEPESDFILDLEEIVAPAEPGYEPSPAPTGSMSCDDCVYLDTCPNKDQRDPQNCGSFQWK